MAQTYIRPSTITENAGIVMLSAKQLLINQLNVSAQNLSNGDTVGFKGFMQNGLETIYKNMENNPNALSISYVQTAPTDRDMAQGALQQTNSPLDMAISGSGYFVVQVNGVRQLTRDGRFRLNGNGDLVTHDGHSVMGDQGPINLAGYTQALIGPKGDIQGVDINNIKFTVGRLEIAAVRNEQTDVEYLGEGRFLPVGEELSWPDNTQVFQGFREQSNVNPIQESIQLMRLMQFYQEAQRIVEMDDTLKTKTMNVKA